MKSMWLFCNILCVFLVSACICGDDNTDNAESINGYKVELLFEKDGCKVYGFWKPYSGGTNHYFTNCTETMDTKTSGKIHYQENIKTSHIKK